MPRSQGGGGFMDTSQFDSPSETKKDTNIRKSQNLICATVQQVLTSSNECLKIGRIEANLLRMVARVKSVEVSSTRIKYELEDDTGTITAISWLDGDAEDTQKGPLVENTYCSVVGSVRSQEGNRYIMLLQAEPLQDANELTAHLLGVVHNELLANKPPTAGQAAAGGAAAAGPSGVTVPAQVKMETGGDLNEQIMRFIMGFSNSDAGVGKVEIQKNFARSFPARQIDAAVDFLCNEGQIYTTVDDEHYKSTE